MTAFLVLSLLVAAHVTRRVDARASEWFRPHDEWGRVQVLLMPVIDALEPRRVLVLLALVGAGVSIRRASLGPAARAALLGTATAALTLATKFALQRPDTKWELTALGGSYPSGHVVALIVALGGCLLILRRHARWWHWPVLGLVVGVMAAALLFTDAHWLTDVVGGSFLGVAVLATASALIRPAAEAEPREELVHDRRA